MTRKYIKRDYKGGYYLFEDMTELADWLKRTITDQDYYPEGYLPRDIHCASWKGAQRWIRALLKGGHTIKFFNKAIRGGEFLFSIEPIETVVLVGREEKDENVTLPRRFLERVLERIQAGLECSGRICDHSVNSCVCADLEVEYELMNALGLNPRNTCERCGALLTDREIGQYSDGEEALCRSCHEKHEAWICSLPTMGEDDETEDE